MAGTSWLLHATDVSSKHRGKEETLTQGNDLVIQK